MHGLLSGVPLISIHVLRVEDDLGLGLPLVQPTQFQSTSSVWRTTVPFWNDFVPF